MKYCNVCKVKVSTNKDVCPLCKNKLTDIGGEEPFVFPEPVKHFDAEKYSLATRIMSFICFVVAGICALINFLTFKSAPYLWSLIVVLGMVYAWYLIKKCIMSQINLIKKLLIQMLILCALILAINLLLTDGNWALDFIIPLIILAFNIATTVIVSAKYMFFREYYIYTFTTLLLGSAPILLFAFSLTKVLWPSLACAAYSLFAFIGMLVFADKQSANELKKRFHF